MAFFNPAQLAKLGAATLPQAAPALQFARENQGVLECSMRPYFNLTTTDFLRRLGLLVFPYVRFNERSANLPLDLYIPFVGHAAYGVAMAFSTTLSTGGFAPSLFTRNVIISAIVVGLEVLAVIGIASSISLKIPRLALISLACYKVFIAAMVLLTSVISTLLYYVVVVVLGIGAGVHLALYGINFIKTTQTEIYLSNRQVSVQNWFVLLWAIMQPIVLLVLTVI